VKVIVKVFGPLKRFLPGKAETLSADVASGTTISALVQLYNIPDDEVWIVTVNGKKVDPGQVLNEGDEVGLFSPVGGG
jgi:molybdopterin converting factor small subunit